MLDVAVGKMANMMQGMFLLPDMTCCCKKIQSKFKLAPNNIDFILNQMD